MSTRTPIYGLLAEFDDAQALLTATRARTQAGYRRHGRLHAVSGRGPGRGAGLSADAHAASWC